MNPFLQVLAFHIAPLCPRLALCLRRVHPYLARHISVEKGDVAAYLRELGYYLGPAAWPRYHLIQSFTSADLTERPDWHGENAWALLNFLCVLLPPMRHCKRWTAEVDQNRGRGIISTIFLWVQEDGPLKELKLLSHSRGDAFRFITYAARCCAPAGCCLECTHQNVKSQRVLKQPQFRWTWFFNQIRGCWQLDCEIQKDVLLCCLHNGANFIRAQHGPSGNIHYFDVLFTHFGQSHRFDHFRAFGTIPKSLLEIIIGCRTNPHTPQSILLGFCHFWDRPLLESTSKTNGYKWLFVILENRQKKPWL